MTDAPAGLLAGRFRVQAPIASGATGEVWRALDTATGRPVALKRLRRTGDAGARARFLAEARLAASLDDPGIAAVLDHGDGPDGPWLAMELVEGRPLSALLEQGPLPLAEALDVVAQTASALAAAHAAGVVHRDVKPGNLLVRPDGVVKVTDFGIALLLDDGGAGIGGDGTVAGTACYLSPEAALGLPVTGRSDLYALGVVVHECLTGRRPFSGADPAALAAAHLHQPPPPLPGAVPTEVRALVGALLTKDPDARPALAQDVARTAAALHVALRAGTGAAPVEVGPSLVGRPYADVERELRDRGLVPRPAYDGSGVRAGSVSAVEPAGRVAVGSEVVVHVAPFPASSSPAPAPPSAPSPSR